MPLRFPEVEEVPLSHAPIREVICQIKFPIILRIANEEPYVFQEKIRKKFPELKKEYGLRLEVDHDKNEGRAAFQPPLYRFLNPDKNRIVSLAPDFYAYSTTSYDHWNAFVEDLAFVAKAFQELYEPAFARRIGLRYMNVIEPSQYNKNFDEIAELLAPPLTGMLKTDVLLEPNSAAQEIRIDDNEDKFTLRHGLIRDQASGLPQYLLDFDRYGEGNLELQNLIDRINRYHVTIYRAFRWCVAPKALELFGAPQGGSQ